MSTAQKIGFFGTVVKTDPRAAAHSELVLAAARTAIVEGSDWVSDVCEGLGPEAFESLAYVQNSIESADQNEEFVHAVARVAALPKAPAHIRDFRCGRIRSRLAEFRSLENGWHHEVPDSVAPSEQACNAALRIVDCVMDDAELPLPYVYPMSCGGISLEWGLDDIGVHIEVPAAVETIEAMSWRRGGGEVCEETIAPTDADALTAWLRQAVSQEAS